MYNNPYYQQPRFQQPMQPQYVDNTQTTLQPQFNNPQFIKPNGLQGKQVDSLEVVKASEVPYDGSVSYFPLTDGSAIITKQLQNDGTSKIIVFKPIEDKKEEIRYITQDDLKNALKDLNLEEIEDIKDDIKEIKKELKKKGD